jgi:hypothetical protein
MGRKRVTYEAETRHIWGGNASRLSRDAIRSFLINLHIDKIEELYCCDLML